MSYQNSIDLLPKELIEQIQQYVDGKVIYIPKKQEYKPLSRLKLEDIQF